MTDKAQQQNPLGQMFQQMGLPSPVEVHQELQRLNRNIEGLAPHITTISGAMQTVSQLSATMNGLVAALQRLDPRTLNALVEQLQRLDPADLRRLATALEEGTAVGRQVSGRLWPTGT